MIVGKHTLEFVKDGCETLTKDIEVVEGQMIAVNEKLITKEVVKTQQPQTPKSPKTSQTPQTPQAPNKTFVTLNVSISTHSKFSYGVTVGQVKRFGWFASVMTNFDFRGFKTDYECDGNFLVDGYYPVYTGKQSFTNLSITGGFMMKIAKPVAVKVVLGYGIRTLSYETLENKWIKNKAESIQGLDVVLGAHFDFGGFVVSLDCVTASFKEFEAKIGLGYGF